MDQFGNPIYPQQSSHGMQPNHQQGWAQQQLMPQNPPMQARGPEMVPIELFEEFKRTVLNQENRLQAIRAATKDAAIVALNHFDELIEVGRNKTDDGKSTGFVNPSVILQRMMVSVASQTGEFGPNSIPAPRE